MKWTTVTYLGYCFLQKGGRACRSIRAGLGQKNSRFQVNESSFVSLRQARMLRHSPAAHSSAPLRNFPAKERDHWPPRYSPPPISHAPVPSPLFQQLEQKKHCRLVYARPLLRCAMSHLLAANSRVEYAARLYPTDTSNSMSSLTCAAGLNQVGCSHISIRALTFKPIHREMHSLIVLV